MAMTLFICSFDFEILILSTFNLFGSCDLILGSFLFHSFPDLRSRFI